MTQFIVHPTQMCQWHALIHEAQVATGLTLNENTESYLVFLLMRYIHATHLMEAVLALDYLTALQSTRPKQLTTLKDIGDKSLLFCGLFPGMAERRHLNLDYFSKLGQAAYLTVSELYPFKAGELYRQLSCHFLTLQQILTAIRDTSSAHQTTPSPYVKLNHEVLQ